MIVETTKPAEQSGVKEERRKIHYHSVWFISTHANCCIYFLRISCNRRKWSPIERKNAEHSSEQNWPDEERIYTINQPPNLLPHLPFCLVYV